MNKYLTSLNTNKTMTSDITNPVLGQAHICGRVKHRSMRSQRWSITLNDEYTLYTEEEEEEEELYHS
jgi:hypothetical protein